MPCGCTVFNSKQDETFRLYSLLMARWVWALALVTAMVGAPVAASVCALTCGSHPMDARHGGAHHHSSASGSPVETALKGAPHSCDHLSSATVAIQPLLQVLTAPSLAADPAFLLPSADHATVPPCALDVGNGPPGALVLITQLRV